MRNLTNHNINANQGLGEILAHTHENGYYQNIENNKCWWRNWNPGGLLAGMWNSAAALENNVVLAQKIKQNYHVIQQFHFWVYIQKNWKQDLENIFVHPCS